MARFTTQVQLNGHPTEEDYSKLHNAMKKRNFTRIVEGGDGKKYWLPHAEYNRDANATLAKVLEDAKTAAAVVSANYEILVTESNGRVWHGLKAATAAEAADN